MTDDHDCSDLSEQTVRNVIRTVTDVRRLPYEWPGEPTADYARERRVGTCSSKHALLAENLHALGVPSASMFVVGALVPEALRTQPAFTPAATLLEVHEFLTVFTSWAGPLRVDVTFDDPLNAHGLPTAVGWDGWSDTPLAVEPTSAGWAAPHVNTRRQKELLRARIYRADERQLRDRTLKLLSDTYAEWRTAQTRSVPT